MQEFCGSTESILGNFCESSKSENFFHKGVGSQFNLSCTNQHSEQSCMCMSCNIFYQIIPLIDYWYTVAVCNIQNKFKSYFLAFLQISGAIIRARMPVTVIPVNKSLIYRLGIVVNMVEAHEMRTSSVHGSLPLHIQF